MAEVNYQAQAEINEQETSFQIPGTDQSGDIKFADLIKQIRRLEVLLIAKVKEHDNFLTAKGYATLNINPSSPESGDAYIATVTGAYTNLLNNSIPVYAEKGWFLKYDGTNWIAEKPKQPLLTLKSKNLCDKSKIRDGYYANQTNNTTPANGSYWVTDLMPVSAGDEITATACNRYHLLRTDLSYVTGAINPSFPISVNDDGFIRISCPISTSKDTFQVEVGSAATEYEPYKNYLHPEAVVGLDYFAYNLIKKHDDTLNPRGIAYKGVEIQNPQPGDALLCVGTDTILDIGCQIGQILIYSGSTWSVVDQNVLDLSAIIERKVKYDSISSILGGGFGSTSYGSTFTGWAAGFDNTGITENVDAIRVTQLRRGAVPAGYEWGYVQLLICEDIAQTIVLAKSKKIKINDPSATTLSDLLFVLYDNTLTSLVSLTPSQLSSHYVMIGYYDVEGTGYAYGGRPSGTIANYISGTSYYKSNKKLVEYVGGWVQGSIGAVCIPFEYVSLENKEIIDHLIELDDIESRLEVVEESVSTNEVEVVLPDTIDIYVGKLLQIYWRSIVKHPNPYFFDLQFVSTVGNNFTRYFQLNPDSGVVGTKALTAYVKDHNGNVIGSKQCSIVVSDTPVSPASQVTGLFVSDSLGDDGVIAKEVQRVLSDAGGDPAGLELTNINMKGRETGGSPEAGWEANGGWTWASYSGAGRAAVYFYVSGVTVLPSMGATYSHNGYTWEIIEVNITAGSGYVSGYAFGGVALSSGTLTKVSGNGDTSIAFSSSAPDSANPFWDEVGGQLDFTNYVNSYMSGDCDFVAFLMTWNGLGANQTDFTSIISTAKTLIDHIHIEYPSALIFVITPNIPSLNGGMGLYGANGGYADGFGMVKTMLNLGKAYQDWCNEASYSSFMRYISATAVHDSENNMPSVDVAVNTTNPETEKRGSNGVHPSSYGKKQIAHALVNKIVKEFCQ